MPLKHEYYIGYDTNKIKDYIFSSSEIRMISGASNLVALLDKEIGHHFKDNIVYAGGGSGLLYAESEEEKERIENSLKEKFKEILKGGKFSIASVSRKELSFQGKELKVEGLTLKPASDDFYSMRGIIANRLAQQKIKDQITPDLIRVDGELELCPICNMYPVRYGEKYCSICQAKEEALKSEKNEEAYKRLSEWNKAIERDGRKAFIYADGNNMGTLIKYVKEEDFKEFSEKLDEVLKKSVEEVFKDAAFRSPILGGDDILLILPSFTAIKNLPELHKKIMDNINKSKLSKYFSNRAYFEEKFGMSYGIFIGDKHFPFRVGVKNAEDLLKKAKKKSYESKTGNGFVSFYLAKTTSYDLSEKENILLNSDNKQDNKGDNKQGIFVAPVFRVEEFEKYRDIAINLIEFSTIVHNIYQMLFDEERAAKLNTTYIVARNKKFRERLVELMRSKDSNDKSFDIGTEAFFDKFIRYLPFLMDIMTICKEHRE